MNDNFEQDVCNKVIEKLSMSKGKVESALFERIRRTLAGSKGEAAAKGLSKIPASAQLYTKKGKPGFGHSIARGLQKTFKEPRNLLREMGYSIE